LIHLVEPTDEEAERFAEVVYGGTPADVAILSIYPDLDEDDRMVMGTAWLGHPEVQSQLSVLYGGDFENMPVDEQARVSLGKSNRERAWFLFSHHYSEVFAAAEKKYEKAYSILAKYYPPTKEGANTPVELFFRQFIKEQTERDVLMDADVDEERQN